MVITKQKASHTGLKGFYHRWVTFSEFVLKKKVCNIIFSKDKILFVISIQKIYSIIGKRGYPHHKLYLLLCKINDNMGQFHKTFTHKIEM